MEYQTYLKQLLEATIKNNASDLHISEGHPPVLRINRELICLKGDCLTAEDAKGISFALMNEEQIESFEKNKEIDFSYDFEGRARFRVNIFYQIGTVSAALRLVPENIRTLEELNLPTRLHQFCEYTQGFILVVGPSSHGKSTTLAALVDEINHTRANHIITIEDPIEYIFKDDKSIINQRELHLDTLSFAQALKSTFREDPDVIMVGEMRDPETMATAITAAETGHLVFATLHTNSAAQTIHRIVDNFNGDQQSQIRAQLASSLVGIISQRLVPSTDGRVVPACEIMLNTPAISNLIRDNKIYEIPLVIETSSESGMVSMNRSLSELIRKGLVTVENASKFSSNLRELRKLI
ncbi:MAG TPA: type IV pilus twitching motility protein PilT [Candidatus Pacearchaeota archaeon]|nr:type IV pilus twitching motility protein PilT [Candidatus Pacearchaeota archaeon]HPR79687.1 type IV pilus twitching motility protein PilT [Candidatus Pacearchaeota archaeon]